MQDAVREAIERSAWPAAVRLACDRLEVAHPGLLDRLEHDDWLRYAIISLAGASSSLTMLLEVDAGAVEVVAALDQRPVLEVGTAAALKRWKAHEFLRIAARDLLGLDSLEVTTASIAALARDVLEGAGLLSSDVAVDGDRLSVIGMGKLGGDELNYASDIDLMFVGDGDTHRLERRARRVMELARSCFRVDANLRPQGRDGPLVRSVESYESYWERWAEAWEFQALLKARSVAGDAAAGRRFDAAAARHLWSRVFSADDLRTVRAMKARAEAEVAKRGLSDREVKRGRGGIRDIEFAIQLLQLVHGRQDEQLRSPTTLTALRELAEGGYVDSQDAEMLADAYRFLRLVEHRLQLVDEQQVHAVPEDVAARTRLARVMGYRDTGVAEAVELFEAELSRHQATVRSIHERLYFRPLLEAFAVAPALGDREAIAEPGELLARPGAAEARLSAFGFADARRTHAAVHELTRGLTRTSRLMQQMLPVLLGWLADAPDPDLGLLWLRNMASGSQQSAELVSAFRESPEAARRLCQLVGTSGLLAEALAKNPDLVGRLGDFERLRTRPRADLIESARRAMAWRSEADERQAGLRRWKDRHLVGIMARDILGGSDVRQVGHDITALAEATLELAVSALEPSLPFAVIALGRFGGAELSYASDLDVVFVYEGAAAADYMEAERLSTALRRFVGGATPALRMWELDVGLRPEGKQGLLARTIEGYAEYFERWALVWERQAMSRARPVAGDPELAARFMGLLQDFVWAPGLSADDVREIRRVKARVERERIPPNEDPRFHLKLGRGSLSDVEFTAQMLQLANRVPAPGTMAALDALVGAGCLERADHDLMAEAYAFCEQTRNRWFLVRGAGSGPQDSLPTVPEQLQWLARSLDTTPAELREHYRRVTRRSRAVVERLFYGRDDERGDW